MGRNFIVKDSENFIDGPYEKLLEIGYWEDQPNAFEFRLSYKFEGAYQRDPGTLDINKFHELYHKLISRQIKL